MDITTLFYIQSSLLFLFGFTMLVNSWSNPGLRGSYLFAAANFSGGFALILQATRNQVPPIFSIVLSNAFLFGYYLLQNKAIADFLNRGRYMWQWLLGFCLLSLAAIHYLAIVHVNLGLRVFIISITGAVCSLATAALLIRTRTRGSETANRVMACLLIFFAVITTVRGVAVWRYWMPSFYFLWPTIVVIAGNAFCFIWMAAARLREDLLIQASTDPLTKTLNRRALELDIIPELRRSTHENDKISALMLDMDYFKGINDLYGHHAGDAALCAVAECLRQHVRPVDHIARLGGDEFLVILPNTGPNAAQQVAERIRLQIALLRVQLENHAFEVRASVGVSTVTGPFDSLEDLMKRSDRALYDAKASGRNCVAPTRAAVSGQHRTVIA